MRESATVCQAAATRRLQQQQLSDRVEKKKQIFGLLEEEDFSADFEGVSGVFAVDSGPCSGPPFVGSRLNSNERMESVQIL